MRTLTIDELAALYSTEGLVNIALSGQKAAIAIAQALERFRCRDHTCRLPPVKENWSPRWKL